MARLAVEIAGVRLKNPLLTASGCFGFGRDYLDFYPLSALGGICLKGMTIAERPGNPPHRLAETPAGMLNSVGLQNPGVQAFLAQDMDWLAGQDVVVAANIAGATPEDYVAVAQALEGSAVHIIELNISCPNVKEGGVAFGTSRGAVESIVGLVRRATTKPLMVKLSPNVADIADIARAAEGAGADALSLINTLTGMRVDINSRRPVLHNNIGGLSGPAVFPVALRMVWQAAQAVTIPVVGLGGISCWQNAVEMLLAGARAVQVGSALFADPMAPIQIIQGLDAWLDSQGVSDVNEIVGALRCW